MAGERWAQVKAMFAQLNDAKLEAAAVEWADFSGALSRANYILADQSDWLLESGLAGEVRRSLSETMDGTVQALNEPGRAMYTALRVFNGVAYYIRDARDQIAAAEAGAGGGDPYPTALSGDPDLRLLQEIQLGQFDELADTYVAALLDKLATSAQTMNRLQLDWPSTLPQGDPAADLGALGVPARPR